MYRTDQRAKHSICLLMALVISACGNSNQQNSDSGATDATTGSDAKVSRWTYNKDVRPIIESRCQNCHVTGGIAPFPLATYKDAVAVKAAMKVVVANRTMPPWHANNDCADYANNISLTDDQIKQIVEWIDDGAVEGPAVAIPAIAPAPDPGLSRVDKTIAMPQAYTATKDPDDYRCFVLDWNETKTKFITGFEAVPGNKTVVHHVIAYLAKPDEVAYYTQLDADEAGMGYTCFGGPNNKVAQNTVNMLGGWAPGGVGADFPANTGIRVDPGSKIILQLHYNTLSAGRQPDTTKIQLKLDDQVQKEARISPFTSVDWVAGKGMEIPAGQKEVMHEYSLDPVAYTYGFPFTIYSAALHMHERGTKTTLSILRKDGTKECLLDIPNWDFHWQRSYGYKKPKVFNPGDKLHIECHWDNSAENQPIIGGKRVTPTNLKWGEGTQDEMCVGFMYVTQ